MNRNTLLVGFGIVCLTIALGLLVPETFGIIGVLLTVAFALWALRMVTPQIKNMRKDVSMLIRTQTGTEQSWWRRQSSITRIAIVLASVFVVVPPTTFLVLFGSATPCGVLKGSLQRKLTQRLMQNESPFAALGLSLGGVMIDRMVDSLSPLECLEKLPDVWSGGDALARDAQLLEDSRGDKVVTPTATPLELASRGSRPGFRGKGCVLNFEVMGGLQGINYVKAYAIGAEDDILDSTIDASDLSIGTILEFSFSEADCDKIHTVRWQGN